MTREYILNDAGEPVPEPNVLKWGRWFEDSDAARMVGHTQIGLSLVSTVFLGLDHQYGDGPPVLWETLVRGGPMADHQVRCSGNREQAEAMHRDMVEKVRESLKLSC